MCYIGMSEPELLIVFPLPAKAGLANACTLPHLAKDFELHILEVTKCFQLSKLV